MSNYMIHELLFFFCSLASGALLSFVYDWIRFFRKMIRHSSVAVAVTDFCYWIGGALFLFVVFYQKNDGILRWYAFVGVVGGMLVYILVVRDRLVNFLVKMFSIPIKLIKKPIKRLIFAFRRCRIILCGLKRGISSFYKAFYKTIYKTSWKKRLHKSEKK
ncbi:MAG: spore cortex biosynthesis protein YabQ [Lachnospiraceae bacterium]|nr:spore cortex biosynthesis protein YabQ [Lachnospiraceae bacterium]